jgi:hypothetical protein
MTRNPKRKVKTVVLLTESVACELRLLAAAEGCSQSEITEAALEAYLNSRLETEAWGKAGEAAFRFSANPADAAYDDLRGSVGPPGLESIAALGRVRPKS